MRSWLRRWKVSMDKVLSMAGLAMKAGKLVSGEFAVSSAVKKHRAFLILTACDASGQTKKSYHDMGRYYGVPVIEYGDMKSLGQCCGKPYRAAVAVTERGFADRIRELIEKGGAGASRVKDGRSRKPKRESDKEK